MAEQAKVQGKEYSWNALVKKFGVDKARQAAPELDPKYQELVKTEGQAKGSADYSHQYIDPSTVTAKGWAGLGSPEQIEQGIAAEKARGGLFPGLEADIGSAIMNPSAGGLGSALTGGKPPAADPTKTKPKTTTGAPAPNPFQTAETNLFNSLVGQYQWAMNIVNPYISGSNAAQYATSAQNVGNAFAGGGVQGQNPTTAGIIGRDEAAYAAANQAGAQGIQNAIQGQGQANAQAMQASPYQSILAALTSEAQYKTETGAGTPALAGATGGAAISPVTDPYAAAVQYASESAGTGTAPGTSTVQGANASVAPVNPNLSTPTTNTSASSGQAGGSS